MINARLLKAIWAVAREKKIDSEGVHEAIQAGLGKTSLKELTTPEALRLLDGMRGKRREAPTAWRGQAQAYAGRRKEAVDEPAVMVNDAELRMLWQAAHARGWSGETLDKFCVKLIGNETPRTMKQFNKVFWAIKAMTRREAAAGAKARLTAAETARLKSCPDTQEEDAPPAPPNCPNCGKTYAPVNNGDGRCPCGVQIEGTPACATVAAVLLALLVECGPRVAVCPEPPAPPVQPSQEMSCSDWRAAYDSLIEHPEWYSPLSGLVIEDHYGACQAPLPDGRGSQTEAAHGVR